MAVQDQGWTRRAMLGAGAGFVVAFSSAAFSSALAQDAPAPEPAKPPPAPKLPGSLDETRLLDAWIRIDPAGHVTVNTGKAELGQGMKTAVLQVAAEELGLGIADIELMTADTARTPNEGYTAGSQSMQMSATAIRAAAAQVRQMLVEEAGRRLGADPAGLTAHGGRIAAPDGRSAGYGELAASLDLHVEARPGVALTPPGRHVLIGKPVPRVDIPAKVTGGAAYVQDIRLPGMVHARMVRPPGPGATLQEVDDSDVRRMPGVLKVVRDGNVLAVVAEGEFQAVKAMRALAAAARWTEPNTLPAGQPIPDVLKGLEREVGQVAQAGDPALPPGARVVRNRFTRPWQMHGSIGPSCAVAHWQDGQMTVWSHTQGVYPDRGAIAQLLGLPQDKVRVIHAQGAGCYGHNGADDAAGDAALVAMAVPGRPVRLQWMREQEHANEPYGPAMTIEVAAALDGEGRVTHWVHDLWSNTHSTRPGGAAALLAGQQKQQAFAPKPATMEITPSGNGDRNADPLYAIPNRDVRWHFLPDMPLRVSALRSLGAYANVFAIESMMDDLAREAGADPVAFRLKHLADERARAVVEKAASAFGWKPGETRAPGQGRGFAFARYKNHAAYLAVAMRVQVDRDNGRVQVLDVVAAIDGGEVINPDGIRNQTEGGIIQSLSWTLFEEVAFDRDRVTSIDWASYPIMRFASVPERVDVHLVDRPGQPFLGSGEAAQGPTAGAVGNALRDALGIRLTELPFNRKRIRMAAQA